MTYHPGGEWQEVEDSIGIFSASIAHLPFLLDLFLCSTIFPRERTRTQIDTANFRSILRADLPLSVTFEATGELSGLYQNRVVDPRCGILCRQFL
jgi:hypothetical protein